MSYYILTNNYNQNTSSTSNGVLAENYDINNPFPPMKYSWTKPRDLDRTYPSELYYIFKGDDFNLDYSNFWDGYIISEDFKNLLDSLNSPKYKLVTLNVINTKGKDISKGRRFFFIDMRNSTQDVIDYASSSFLLNEEMIKMRGLNVEEVKMSDDYFGNIKEYDKILLKTEKIGFNIFKLKDLIIHDLICDEECYLRIRDGFQTVECTNLMNIQKYNSRFK